MNGGELEPDTLQTNASSTPAAPANRGYLSEGRAARPPTLPTHLQTAADVQPGMALDQRGLRQRSPGKRAKSESLECNSAWYSNASAAR